MGVNETLRALADPTRRRILDLLRAGDMTAGEIAENFELAKSTLSGHFNVLKSAGLIVSERSRNKVVYSINMSAFDDAAAAVMSVFKQTPRGGRGHPSGEEASKEVRDG